jgi:hypothetical protein
MGLTRSARLPQQLAITIAPAQVAGADEQQV